MKLTPYTKLEREALTEIRDADCIYKLHVNRKYNYKLHTISQVLGYYIIPTIFL